MNAAVPLRGVFPMLVTPFAESGELDRDSLARLVSFVLEGGAHGLSILGLAGEGSSLRREERRLVTDIVIARSPGSPVIIACTADDASTAADLARHAADAGAAAVMVAPPRRGDWPRERLREYFGTVADTVAPLPLMIQDAPAFVGVSLDVEFVLGLARSYPNVRYAKPEGLPAAERAAERVEHLTVFGGHGGLHYLDVLEAGGAGMIPGCDLPEVYSRIFDGYLLGNVDEARDRFHRVLPLIVFEFQGLDFYISAVKTILLELGVIKRTTLREVANSLGPVSARLLRSHARAAGVLPT